MAKNYIINQNRVHNRDHPYFIHLLIATIVCNLFIILMAKYMMNLANTYLVNPEVMIFTAKTFSKYPTYSGVEVEKCYDSEWVWLW